MRRWVLASTVVVGLVFPLAGVVVASHGGAHAWFDAPLGTEVVTSVPVAIVAHVAEPTGVAGAEVAVDGEVLAGVPGTGEALQLVEVEWKPTESGTYFLSISGRGMGGDWGEPGVVVVTVDLGPGEGGPADTTTTSTRPTSTTTTTPRPTSTTTTTTRPTTTSTTTTTTTTACALGIPSPTGPTGSVALNVVTLTWSYPGCREPEEFELQLSREPGFARIDHTGAAAGDQRSWVSPPLACATWYWRIRTYDFGSYGSWSSTGSFSVSMRGC